MRSQKPVAVTAHAEGRVRQHPLPSQYRDSAESDVHPASTVLGPSPVAIAGRRRGRQYSQAVGLSYALALTQAVSTTMAPPSKVSIIFSQRHWLVLRAQKTHTDLRPYPHCEVINSRQNRGIAICELCHANLNRLYLSARASRFGLSSRLRGRLIRNPCISCNPYFNIGPSVSLSISARISVMKSGLIPRIF